ncbi:MAG TPA: hypothetical protein VEB22_10895 [Phycisphaerales bacterium]|nr:hypothetical protein [Phycisphaerales bacterium]
MKLITAVVSVSVAALCAPVHADFLVPNGVNAPWVRGVNGPSAYAQWESFTSVAGPNTPGIGPTVLGSFAPGAPAFNVWVTGPTAVRLGSGNIYSGNAPMSVAVTVPSFGLGGGAFTTILLQTRTQGTEINPATMLIGGVAPSSVLELSRISLGGQGAQVETAWRWDLPDSQGAYTIAFSSGGPFFSLDAVAVDIFADIPAPGAATVLGLGILAAARRRR